METIEVRIEKLIYGGEGLAHHDAHAVFVPFVLPEEVVAVQPVVRRRKFVRGRLERVVTPSPQRAAAACRHFTICGGCDYQHIPYPAQLDFKVQILRETLGRIGGLQHPGEIVTHPSAPYGYRNRAQWKIRSASDPGDVAAIGYERAATHAFCAVEQCPILAPRLEQTLKSLRDRLAQGALPAGIMELEAFADPAHDPLLLTVSFSRFPAGPRRIAAMFHDALPGLESLLLYDASRDRFELDGPGYIVYTVGEMPYRVGHLSFFQVNHTLLDRLRQAVTRDAVGTLALELYAGVGFFTVPLSTSFERVVAVESNPAAVRDLKENLRAAATDRVQVVEGSVEKYLAGLTVTPDLIVLDPPRGGVVATALAQIARLAPARIRYLSCDPATLARDLAALGRHAAGAYEVVRIELFDLFPQTYHIETLVELVRRA
jgi:23S rRNA (uracil1939-C5)-methyltransferase